MLQSDRETSSASEGRDVAKGIHLAVEAPLWQVVAQLSFDTTQSQSVGLNLHVVRDLAGRYFATIGDAPLRVAAGLTRETCLAFLDGTIPRLDIATSRLAVTLFFEDGQLHAEFEHLHYRLRSSSGNRLLRVQRRIVSLALTGEFSRNQLFLCSEERYVIISKKAQGGFGALLGYGTENGQTRVRSDSLRAFFLTSSNTLMLYISDCTEAGPPEFELCLHELAELSAWLELRKAEGANNMLVHAGYRD